MFDENKSREIIAYYKTHYHYDTTYMEEMLNVSPKAYEVFESFLPMASFTNKAPLDVINTVRITSIINEDCGTCAQLYVDLAIEAGMDKELIKEIVFNNGKNLPTLLKNLYDFVLAVSNNDVIDAALYAKIDAQYSKEIQAEIALAIAATKVFPAIKKVMNLAQSCSLIKIKV